MPGPPNLSSAELGTLSDPAELLVRAHALEPALRLSERTATLARLEEVLESGRAPAPPPGRDWDLELLAERAVDAARLVQLDEAAELVDKVLRAAEPSHEIAIVRALMARGNLLAWTGTEAATRRADAVYQDAIERCRALGKTDWHGHLLFWRGNTVFYQNGELTRAAALMREALTVLGEDSPRRSTVLTFYADVLIELGEWDAVAEALDQARAAADRDGDVKSHGYIAWSGARVVSAQGDALGTERALREVERGADDWFEIHTGVAFLADAAEMLDRVGLGEQAQRYLARAMARAPDNEFVRQAEATLMARSGDPGGGLEALQELMRGNWLEKRLWWRHMLLSAWATFRAGRAGAGELAAQALERAVQCGGVRVALAGEPELTRAMAPLAELTGSAPARELLVGERGFLVRLFGAPTVTRSDGSPIELPLGRPGELVRLLALHDHGLSVDAIIEAFFPDVDPSSGRLRLRQILHRLRAVADDLVVRREDHLQLAPAWVDVRAFLAAADRMRAARGGGALQAAYAALAMRRGPLLPHDEYADWADTAREEVNYRHVTILETIAKDAAARGSSQEALTALDALSGEGYATPEHLWALRRQLLALGRTETVRYLSERASER